MSTELYIENLQLEIDKTRLKKQIRAIKDRQDEIQIALMNDQIEWQKQQAGNDEPRMNTQEEPKPQNNGLFAKLKRFICFDE